jgi:hypothetical protein
MEPVDYIHEWAIEQRAWLDNEISKQKRTVAMYEGNDYPAPVGKKRGQNGRRRNLSMWEKVRRSFQRVR